MAEPHVVAALKDKRAELSGSIADLEKRIGQHRADLLHVDAVLRLFAPEFELATIPSKAVRQPSGWFRPGELAQMVLEVMRTAPTAACVHESDRHFHQSGHVRLTSLANFRIMGSLV